jgi:hypothetical protein
VGRDGRPKGALEAAAAERGRAALPLGAQVRPAPGAASVGVGPEVAFGRADEAVELGLGSPAPAADAAADGDAPRYLASRAARATSSVPAWASAWWAGRPQ